MWKVDFARDEDFVLLTKQTDTVINELNEYFKDITKTFDQLNNSVMCTSVIYTVKSYNSKDGHLFINYHIDSDEKHIRITSVDII